MVRGRNMGEYMDLSQHTNELYDKLNMYFSDVYESVKKKLDIKGAKGVAVVYIPTDAPELLIEHKAHGRVNDDIIDKFKELLRRFIEARVEGRDIDEEKELQKFAEKHDIDIYNISEYDEAYLILFY